MPQTTPWDPAFACGNPVLDAQHQALLELCNRLAGHCARGQDEAWRQAFDEDFNRLIALAHEHFQAEAALLAALMAAPPTGHEGDAAAGLEDHRIECDEFDYLVHEIATTDNFDRVELQRFLALWWLGHLRRPIGALAQGA